MPSRRTRSQPVLPPRLGVPEAADYCGVDESTIRRWIARGQLRANRIGPRLIKIDRAELDKLIEPIGGES